MALNQLLSEMFSFLPEEFSFLFEQSVIDLISGLVVIFFIIGLFLHINMSTHGKLFFALSVLWTAFVPVVLTVFFALGIGLIFLVTSYISEVLAIILVPLFLWSILYTAITLVFLPELLIEKNHQPPTPTSKGQA